MMMLLLATAAVAVAGVIVVGERINNDIKLYLRQSCW